MIKNILEMLPYVEGGSELIDIAKGKYKYPETFEETFKTIKEWRKN
jgi:hypothetical protein|tara:strand:+ start:3862 stop:3999 length:138 start_codon:yes stop_codon:yes gene_type:complete